MRLNLKRAVAEALLARIEARREADVPPEWMLATMPAYGQRWDWDGRGWARVSQGPYEVPVHADKLAEWSREAAVRADARRRQSRFLRRILAR